MSDRNSLDPTRGAAIMRHALERIIRPELQRTVRTVDRATAGGEKVRVERSVGYVDEQRLVLTPTLGGGGGGGIEAAGVLAGMVTYTQHATSMYGISLTSFVTSDPFSEIVALDPGVIYDVLILSTHGASAGVSSSLESRAFLGSTYGPTMSVASTDRAVMHCVLSVPDYVGAGDVNFGIHYRAVGTNSGTLGPGAVTLIAVPKGQPGGGGLTAIRVESQTVPVTTPNPTKAIDFGAGFLLGIEDALGVDTDTDEVNVGLDFGAGANQVARGDHTHALSDLSNVSTVTPASGQVLQYTGSQWAPATVAGTASPSASMVTPYPGAHLGPLNHAAGPITNANSFGAGWVYLYPFDVPATCTVNWLGIAKGNTASTNVKIGLWASGADRFPTGAPLRSNVVATGTGTGLVGASVSALTLTPGRYWLGFSLQAAVNLVGISNANSTIPLIAPTAAEITATNVVRETGFGLAHTYTNALPTNPSFASRSFFLNSVPSVWARVA